ncbi:MAG TPA: gliding motility-associated C-terminal domain-containing protein, partial [Prolixibacteraceae bacterium]|nr:gliding motility-associated C-terminal domain-containing protein [Prolixibacteraceae bacterium]
ASIEIFNRWGNLVYKKEKYGNVSQWGEADAWWGGYSNRSLSMGKEKLPTGTYFYILKLNSGEEAPVTGTVFLNR